MGRSARISASRLSPLTNSSPTRVIRNRNRCERTEDTAGQSTGRAPSDLLRRVLGTLKLRYETEGRAYYDRKIAEGKTSKEAVRALKRRISDRIYRHLIADARRSSTS